MNWAEVAHEEHFECRYIIFDQPDGSVVVADNNPIPGYRELRAKFVEAAEAAGLKLEAEDTHGDGEKLEDYTVAWHFSGGTVSSVRDILAGVFVEHVVAQKEAAEKEAEFARDAESYLKKIGLNPSDLGLRFENGRILKTLKGRSN